MQLTMGRVQTSVVYVAWKSWSQGVRARLGRACRKPCGLALSIARGVKCGPFAGPGEAVLLTGSYWGLGAVAGITGRERGGGL